MQHGPELSSLFLSHDLYPRVSVSLPRRWVSNLTLTKVGVLVKFKETDRTRIVDSTDTPIPDEEVEVMSLS